MPKRFQSCLASEMEAFMHFKHALGQSYHRGCHTLRRFDRYVAAHHPQRRPLNWPALVSGWLGDRPVRKPITVVREMSVLRQFCLFRRRADAGAFLPDTQWVPPLAVARFAAYPLSTSQVAELIRRTQDLEDLPLRRSGIRALLCLLYSTGLRLGEALRLQCTDVDWNERRFFIRTSKGRSRWVSFRKDLLRELNKYREERRGHLHESPESFLLCRADGSAYSVPCASVTIRQLMRQAGFKPAQGRLGPRPHDLRHAFANERLRRWYRSGVDLQRRLPDLSVYLGHQNLFGTEIYLKARLDLLRVASRNLARRFRKSEQ